MSSGVSFSGRARACALALVGLGSSLGAPPGTTGAPGADGAEPTCAACHAGRAQNPDELGAVALDGLPARYEPGRRYELHLVVSHPDPAVRRFGFQLTALAAATLAGAGELVVTDPANTQRVDAIDGSRQYLGHTLAGTAPAPGGGARWDFAWVAPAASVGAVAFFAAANAADADGSKEGDRVYSPSPRPLASVAGAAGPKEKP